MLPSPARLMQATLLLAAAHLLPATGASAASGQNSYGGYDIAGIPGIVENPYGETRGWQVVSATLKGRFAYCAGIYDDNGTPWRLGTDGQQWQLALPMTAKPDWQGYLGVDGDSRPTSGSAARGWTFLWLWLPERDKIGAGSDMTIKVGSRSVHHPLIGTAAVITKIEECMSRKGQPPKSASAAGSTAGTAPASPASSAPRTGGPCPDDGPRLPVTGLCRGQATAYLGPPPSPDLFIFPDKACSWDLQEAALPDDSVLLFRVLSCKGVTSHLDLAGGAHYAQLIPDRSAIDAAYDGTGKVTDAKPLAWITPIDPANVQRDLVRASAEGLNASVRKKYKCRLTRSKAYDGYVYGADPATLPDEPTPAVCGPFSEGDGVTRFWRVFGDYAILFDLPGEAYQEFDPVSMVLLHKNDAGNWVATP
ncbi:hypothetical protein ACRC7T_17970 [Segnochrobactraceae bacterium EtOH-i3]